MTDYCVALKPTPVLHTPDFRSVFGGVDGRSLPLDDQGLLRPVEFIALPGTGFEIIGRKPEGIFHVKIPGYGSGEFYIDQRFTLAAEQLMQRKPSLPSKELFLARLKTLLQNKTRYIWGGNYSGGIAEMLAYYPPSSALTTDLSEIWTLKGVDCSGMIYECCDGALGRNTSDLIHAGSAVEINTDKELLSQLRPLDLIVWRGLKEGRMQGHVVVVMPEGQVIESRGDLGVVQSGLIQRLTPVLAEYPIVTHWGETTDRRPRSIVRRIFQGLCKP